MAAEVRFERTLSSFFGVDDIRYTARPTRAYPKIRHCLPCGDSQHRNDSLPITFVTVLASGSRQDFDTTWLIDQVAHSLATDDVLRKQFLHNIVLCGFDACEPQLVPELEKTLRSWHTDELAFAEKDENILPGPYIHQQGQLWQICRRYSDTNGAFLIPVVQNSDGRQVVKLCLCTVAIGRSHSTDLLQIPRKPGRRRPNIELCPYSPLTYGEVGLP